MIIGLFPIFNDENCQFGNTVDSLRNSEPYKFHSAMTITTSDGSIIGNGHPANVTLSCNKSSDLVPATSNTLLGVPLSDPWKITSTNISVFDITQDSDIVIVEDSITTNKIDVGNELWVMQFNASQAILKNFSIYVHNIRKVTDIIGQVYTSKLEGENVIPNTLIGVESFGALDDTQDNQWHTFTFSSGINLNPTATYNNVFFLGLYPSVGGKGNFEWGYELDSLGEDYGAAYMNEGSAWNLQPWDFNLKIGLVNHSKKPSEIGLKVNNENVTDLNDNDGIWISHSVYSSSEGRVNYQFSANNASHFQASWSVTYRVTFNNSVTTNFKGFATSKVIYWNATYESTFIENSFDRQLEFSLPIWKSVMDVQKNQTLHNQWITNIRGTTRIVTIFNAANGIWTIRCNDTNYIETVYAKRAGIIVSVINSTDSIEIFGNFTEILSSGDANLTIFPIDANYNDTTGEMITSNKTIRFDPAWIPIKTAKSSFTEARLQITWCNGTAAGINMTILSINHIPTNITYVSHTETIESGESIFCYVNFTNSYTNEIIDNPTLIVKNSSDGTTWPNPFKIIRQFPNGTLEIEIITIGISSPEIYISINLSKPLYLSSELTYINVTVTGILSNISVTAPNCFGLLPLNESYAIVDPAPYHNSSVKVSIYYFSNDTGEPLRNAIITPSWIGGGPEVYWVPAFFGYYNITIDVTGFHADTNHTLKLSIQQSGYEAATLYIIVNVKKLPTVIESFETSYNKYLEETFILYAVFKDVFNDRSIPSIYKLGGNFTIRIGDFADNMSLLTQSMGIYQYELTLSTLGLEENKTYNVTLFAFSQEHELSMINITLYVIPKAQVELKLLGVPSYTLAGTQFNVYANLTIANGPPIYDTPLIFTVHFQPGSLETQSVQLTNESGIAELYVESNPAMKSIQIEVKYLGNITVQNKITLSQFIPIVILNSSLTLSPLPNEIMQGESLEINATLLINGTPVADELITFTFTYEGSDRVDELSAGTDDAGIATVTLKVPTGVSKIYVTATYEGTSYVTEYTTNSETHVISIMTLVWRYAPIWLSILAIIFGAIIAYQVGYKRPKLRRLRALWQKSAEKFRDSANLDFLMIILKESGVSVYNYAFKGEDLDYALMGGFLTAISTFQQELIRKGDKLALEKEEWEISYHNFKIYGITKGIAQFVLILEDSPSEDLKNALFSFGQEVEKQYEEKLKHYTGKLEVFKPIDLLVQKHFEGNLILPQVAQSLTREQLKNMSDLERKLYKLGTSLMKEQGYFYISTILESALAMLKEERNHILDIIYNLVKKEYFRAITLEELQELRKNT